ncbi:MAG: acetate kinase [Pseudomonadota bacterium]
MQQRHKRIGVVSLFTFLLGPQALARSAEGPDATLEAKLQALQQQLAEQQQLLRALKEQVREQDTSLRALGGGAGAASPAALARRRGMGGAPAAPDEGAVATQVGQAPEQDKRPPAVAPLFEQPGVLTPKGKYVLEPSFQFGYSSSNRVALVGYTIIPSLLIGLVDVREVKRNTFTGALTGRLGLTNRLELEVKVPYVYRSDSTVSRELFTGTAVERVFETNGRGVGDAELGVRYQINDGGPDSSYYIGALRVKSRTGRDPFEVVTDCTTRCVGENATGTGLPLELPTGSGFYAVQPSVTWLYPSDPAILFGSVSYLYNVRRQGVSRRVLNGEIEELGTVAPGAVFGFNFGMGLALNDKASLSLGYDHSSIGRTKQNGVAVPGSVRTQLGTLLVGFSYRFSEQRSINIAVGAGLTRDTPDVSLSFRMPMTF